MKTQPHIKRTWNRDEQGQRRPREPISGNFEVTTAKRLRDVALIERRSIASVISDAVEAYLQDHIQ